MKNAVSVFGRRGIFLLVFYAAIDYNGGEKKRLESRRKRR